MMSKGKDNSRAKEATMTEDYRYFWNCSHCTEAHEVHSYRAAKAAAFQHAFDTGHPTFARMAYNGDNLHTSRFGVGPLSAAKAAKAAA